MNGTNPIGAGVVGASNPGPSWHVKGDRRLQRRRQVRHPLAEQRRDARDLADEWLNPIGAAVVGASNPGPSWQIKATGDFNGDGKSDILWQNTDGTPAIWLMNG